MKIIYGVMPVLEALRADKAVDRVMLSRASGGKTQRIVTEARRLGKLQVPPCRP